VGQRLANPAYPVSNRAWLVPLLLLVCAPVLLGAREVRLSRDQADDAQVAPRPIRLLLVLGTIVSLQCAAEGPARAFFNVYLDRSLGVPPTQIGLMIGLAQIMPVAAAILSVRLLRRWAQP
jgi:hypothetical protein